MNYGKLISHSFNNGTLTLEYEHTTAYIQQMSDGIIRFTTNPDKKSYAVILPPMPEVNWEISEKEDFLCVKIHSYENNERTLLLKIGNDFMVDIFENDKLICSDYRGRCHKSSSLSDSEKKLLALEGHNTENDNSDITSVEIVKVLDKDDSIYGLGDKPGCLNKRGYAFENWNTDDPAPHVDSFRSLYKSIPFFIVLKSDECYGILADNTYRTTFDFGKENSDCYSIRHENGDLNYYFISGADMAQVVSLYTDLTGHAVLPQKWLFGYHQSRWSYGSETEVRDLAAKFKEYDIPCDCIHLDIDYMDGYRVFTFDSKRFPNPEKLVKDLEKQGIKLITIVDPGVKKDKNYDVYKKGMEMDAFAHSADGTVYENEVWPGTSVFPDFTREDIRVWWGENIKKLTDIGIRGIWNDMNEPATFKGPLPDDVVFADGEHSEIHNVYGHLMAQATYDALKKYDSDRRPFILTRACYAGSQRYCGGWTGDNHSIWSHIPLAIEQMCNLGLCGMMMCGSDIGGFGSDATPELMIRFFQAAVFSPFFRSHSAMGTKRQEPWAFDEETTDIIRKVIKLRYRFLPYIYDLAHECVRTGAPILRPLVYEFPYDKNVRNLGDEYMLGSQVLAAPVIQAGKTARAVYLPAGKWYDFTTGVCYNGGQYILADAPLDHIPIYIREGSILPLVNHETNNTDEFTEDDIVFHTYQGTGRYVHYIDDGVRPLEKQVCRKVIYELNEYGELSVNSPD